MTRFSFAVVALGALTFAALTPAHAETYVLESGHTRAEFRVSHLGFSEMPGMFSDIKGRLEFDPAKPEQGSIEATINANSVTMNHAVLDGKLKGKDFFNTAKYPTITFKSTDIDRDGSASGTIKGNLTMLGVTRPVTLDVTFSKKAWNKYAGAEAVGFTAFTKIHRSDFGMKYLLPDVGDDVTIRLDVEAVKAKPSDLVDKAADVKIINTTDKKSDEQKKESDNKGGVQAPEKTTVDKLKTPPTDASTDMPAETPPAAEAPPAQEPSAAKPAKRPRMGAF